jgi:hypothetical protein
MDRQLSIISQCLSDSPPESQTAQCTTGSRTSPHHATPASVAVEHVIRSHHHHHHVGCCSACISRPTTPPWPPHADPGRSSPPGPALPAWGPSWAWAPDPRSVAACSSKVLSQVAPSNSRGRVCQAACCKGAITTDSLHWACRNTLTSRFLSSLT